MAHTVLILIMLIYTRKCEQKSNFHFWGFPVFFMLVSIYSFQYYVGTDYPNYYSMSISGDTTRIIYYAKKGEVLFSYLIQITQFIGEAQFIFFFSALIQMSMVFIAFHFLKAEGFKVYDMLFLYFALLNSYFSQFNGMRNYIAVDICIVSFLLIAKGKFFLPMILTLIATLFHTTAWGILPIQLIFFFWVKKKLFINRQLYFLLLLISFFMYFIDLQAIIDEILRITDFYAHFIGRGYVQKMNFVNILTRILKLIPFIYVVCKIKIHVLSNFEKNLLTLGYASSVIMVLQFSSSLINRLYYYFDFFLMIPFLIYFKYSCKVREKSYIFLYLMTCLLVKLLLFPSGEYLYQSIFFINLF